MFSSIKLNSILFFDYHLLVERIGKYKSFGDTFNRTTMSDAQREVISSLLMEGSNFWENSISGKLNKSIYEVYSLWSDYGIKNISYYKNNDFITGINYLDEIEDYFLKNVTFNLQKEKNENETSIINDFNLNNEFQSFPRRSLITPIVPANSISSLTSKATRILRRRNRN